MDSNHNKGNLNHRMLRTRADFEFDGDWVRAKAASAVIGSLASPAVFETGFDSAGNYDRRPVGDPPLLFINPNTPTHAWEMPGEER